jgi:protein-L-isoaspartate(D-aspartate) O-methyltransferase
VKQLDYAADRERMVRSQIQDPYDSRPAVSDASVLRAMRNVPRHLLVPDDCVSIAYEDRPLPIGHGQTISQPYIVAFMTELLRSKPEHVVLEVGTGSGYQAAVLAELVERVYSVEIVEPLAVLARQRLEALGYDNIVVRAGDGYQGWPEHAPFDSIIVTAAPEQVPQTLVEQLKPGGRLVLPVGPAWQTQYLVVVDRHPDGEIEQREVMAVGFVPLVRAIRN